MEIRNFWVVTKPTPQSTMQDICFCVESAQDLYNQFMGGLHPCDIVAFYADQDSAEEKARQELHAAQNTN